MRRSSIFLVLGRTLLHTVIIWPAYERYTPEAHVALTKGVITTSVYSSRSIVELFQQNQLSQTRKLVNDDSISKMFIRALVVEISRAKYYCYTARDKSSY